MKNPGSSSPTLKDITASELSNLNRIDDSEKWYIFTEDPTMTAIVSLFCKGAESKGEVFEGIIQIFNIINVMSPDLEHAVKLFQSISDPAKSTWESDIKNIIPPVYIGWGNFYRHHLFSDIGTALISAINGKEYIEYLAQSGFTHPLYLMVFGANKPKCIAIRENFYKHFCQISRTTISEK